VAVVCGGLHEPGEVGARGSKLTEQVFRRHTDLRRQRTIVICRCEWSKLPSRCVWWAQPIVGAHRCQPTSCAYWESGWLASAGFCRGHNARVAPRREYRRDSMRTRTGSCSSC